MYAKEKGGKSRRGLYGWRAFFAVFGCGTVAAFVVMGIIIGSLNMFFSALSSPEQRQESPLVLGTRQPRETTKPGVLDLCELVEAQAMMSATTGNRINEGDQYEDTALSDKEADPRTVSDSCTWEVSVGATEVWNFNLEYVAYMETKGNSDLIELAERRFESEVGEVENVLKAVEEEGDIENLKREGDGKYFYSPSDDGGGFVFIRRVKSGVYVVTLTSSDRGTGKTAELQDYRVETVKVAEMFDEAFERQIPDL